MLQLFYRDYHISNQDQIKKAVIISFSEQVTESTINDYCKELKELIIKEYDAYIFYIRQPEHFYAYSLKLMIAFSNTYTGKTGLLVKNTNQEMYRALHLDSVFIFNNDIKTILMLLERTKGK